MFGYAYRSCFICSPRRAFTLVELIIVIGIISLLLSIILSALGQSRKLARQIVCQSQLRQWSLAFTIYAQENGDFFPHIDGLDRRGDETPLTAADRADYYGWVDLLPPLIGMNPWRNHIPGKYPKDDTLFQCPTVRKWTFFNYNIPLPGLC